MIFFLQNYFNTSVQNDKFLQEYTKLKTLNFKK